MRRATATGWSWAAIGSLSGTTGDGNLSTTIVTATTATSASMSLGPQAGKKSASSAAIRRRAATVTGATTGVGRRSPTAVATTCVLRTDTAEQSAATATRAMLPTGEQSTTTTSTADARRSWLLAIDHRQANNGQKNSHSKYHFSIHCRSSTLPN
jgi:hypothetical protein